MIKLANKRNFESSQPQKMLNIIISVDWVTIYELDMCNIHIKIGHRIKYNSNINDVATKKREKVNEKSQKIYIMLCPKIIFAIHLTFVLREKFVKAQK
jgi:hypothetical protein